MKIKTKTDFKKDFQDSSRRGRPRFRSPKFDPNTDNHISFLQVLYGEYHRGFPVIERVWVYEKFTMGVVAKYVAQSYLNPGQNRNWQNWKK